jgi:hypothetical protein
LLQLLHGRQWNCIVLVLAAEDKLSRRAREKVSVRHKGQRETRRLTRCVRERECELANRA